MRGTAPHTGGQAASVAPPFCGGGQPPDGCSALRGQEPCFAAPDDQAPVFRAPRTPPWCCWHLDSDNHLRGVGGGRVRLWSRGQWLFCKEGSLHWQHGPRPRPGNSASFPGLPLTQRGSEAKPCRRGRPSPLLTCEHRSPQMHGHHPRMAGPSALPRCSRDEWVKTGRCFERLGIKLSGAR